MGVTEWLLKCSTYNVVFVYVNSTTRLLPCDNSESKWKNLIKTVINKYVSCKFLRAVFT